MQKYAICVGDGNMIPVNGQEKFCPYCTREILLHSCLICGTSFYYDDKQEYCTGCGQALPQKIDEEFLEEIKDFIHAHVNSSHTLNEKEIYSRLPCLEIPNPTEDERKNEKSLFSHISGSLLHSLDRKEFGNLKEEVRKFLKIPDS